MPDRYNRLRILSATAICLMTIQHMVAQEFNWALNPRGISATHHAVSTVDASGSIYTVGHFEGIVDFDPGLAVFEFKSEDQHDVFVSRINSNGTMVWTKRFTGPLDDQAVAITVDGTGNIYVTGTFQGTVDFDPGVGTSNLTSSGGIDFFVCKLSSSGQFLWARGFGSASSADVSKAIAVDPDGNVFLTGNFLGTIDFDPGVGTTNLVSAGSTDIFICKLDPSGNFLWAKQIGSTAAETCNNIHVDAAGGAYITGSFSGTVDFDPNAGVFNLVSAGSTDIFVCKLDASGNFSLAISFGGTSAESGNAVKVDLSGNIYVAGNFQGTADFDPGIGIQALTSTGSTDIFVAKYDASGSFIWTRKMGGGAADRVLSLAVDGAANVYTTGDFISQADFDPGALTYTLPARVSENTFISKLDASGNFLWAKNIYGDPQIFFYQSRNSGYSIGVDGSGNVVVTGIFYLGADFDPGEGTYSLESPLGNNIFTIKLNSSGTFIFAKDFGHAASGEAKSVVFDGTENIYSTGSFSGNLVFDWGPEIEVASAGLSDIFVVKQYEEGEYLWAVSIGGSLNDAGTAIVYDPAGNIYVTGFFNGTVDFDPGPGTFELISAGGDDIFVCKLAADGTFVWAKRIGGLASDLGRSLSLDMAGNIVIVGTYGHTVDFDPGPGTYNLSFGQSFYCKLDSEGTFLLAGSFSDYVTAQSVSTNAAGDFYVTGYFSRNSADFDPGAGEFYLTPAGTDGAEDLFVAKFSSLGEFIWAKRIGAGAADFSNAVVVDRFDNLYITGNFRGTVDFDPGPGTLNLFSPISTGDIFVAKLNSSGDLLWAKSMSGSLDDSGNSLSADIGGNVYVTGYFHGTVDFDPGPGIFDPTSLGESDMFIAKLDPNGNFMWAASYGTDSEDVSNSITVSPAGHFYIAGTSTGILEDGWHDQGGDLNIYVLRFAVVDEPTVQASKIEFSSFSTNSVELNYTDGSGFNRLIVAREGSAVNSEPVFREEYSANNVFGSGSEIGTGNFVVGQGTGPLTVTGLSPGTTYHFRIFEFNGTHFEFDAPSYNTALVVGNPSSTSTLTHEPSAHPANFTAAPPVGSSNNSITLSFPAALTISNGYGYIVLRREDGSVPTVSGIVDRVAPTAFSLPPGTTLVTDISSTSTDAYLDEGLSANIEYTYLIIPYNYNGSAHETYNYKTDGTPLTTSATPVFSAISDIIAEPAFVYPANISYSNYQATDLTYNNSLEVFQFTLRDGGNNTDADNAPTMLSSISLSVTNGSLLKRIAIYDGLTEIAETVSGGSALNFSNLALTASDDNSTTFSLRVSFNSTVADNEQFSFAITGTVVVAGNSSLGSADGGGALSSISGDNNRLEVTASKIVFTTQPPPLLDVNVSVTPSPVIETLDGLDNRDVDYSAPLTVTNSGSLAVVNPPVAFTSGVAAFPADFQFASYGEARLFVSSGSLADGASNELVVRAAEPGVQPTSLAFLNILSNSLNGTFTASTDNAAGYIVLRKQGVSPPDFPDDGATYSAGQNIQTSEVIYVGSNTMFADTDLLGGTAYYYSIFSYNGEGQAINYLTAAPLQGNILTTPVAPTGVQATDKTTSHFLLVWHIIPGAASYELDVSLASDFSTFIDGYNGKPVTGNEWSVEGLQPNTDHYVRLRAVNSSGESANSAVIAVRTLEGTVGGVLSIAVPMQSNEGENIALSVTVTPGAEVPTVNFHARGITADEFTPTTLTPTSNTYKVIVVPSMLDELGLEYFFEASDKTGTVRHPNNGYVYRQITTSSAATSIPFLPGFNGSASTYQMFSIPYVSEDRSIAGIFNELGAYDKTVWRLFHYDGNSSKYFEYQSGLPNNIETGKGYWFNSKEALPETIQVGSGTVVQANQQDPFQLTLSAGWNQIGNPYPFNISWSAVIGANEKISDLNFFSNGGYTQSDVFKPWTGAFVHADEAMTLAIPVTAKTNASGRTKEALQPDLDAEQWLLPITLRINDLHQTSGVGMHPEAKSSKDKFDEITVPRFLDYAEMNTYHEEFFSPRFSTDVVPTGEEQTWIFDVKSNLEDQQGELTWDHASIATNKSSLILIDLFDGRWVDMKTTGSYTFTHNDGRQFKVIYNREGEIKPGMTLLGEAYPNPFVSEVTFPVLVDKHGYKQIVIYDGFGRKIRTIGSAFDKPGQHEITWDLKDNGGNEVSSGLLFYRLEGGPDGRVKRMVRR